MSLTLESEKNVVIVRKVTVTVSAPVGIPVARTVGVRHFAPLRSVNILKSCRPKAFEL